MREKGDIVRFSELEGKSGNQRIRFAIKHFYNYYTYLYRYSRYLTPRLTVSSSSRIASLVVLEIRYVNLR